MFFAVTFVAIAGALFLPRIPQPPAYHDFSDERTVLGVPNFGDVVSNLGFLAAGIYGIAVTLRRRQQFADGREIAAWLVLFVGLVLTTFGSSYYHLRPDNARLFWDRLPMTLGFMGLFAALLGERISVRLGFRLLPLLIACGIASLVYWIWSEQMGRGDLRPYLLVQFYPLVAVILLLWLFPPRYTRGYDYLIALGFYALAKVVEVADRAIYALSGQVVSGHNLKHLAAAVGGYWLARMLAKRERSPGGPST